ncbi:MAG: hypothetical protein JWM46_341 [Candidatus Kaiserbacteria bacterium]|nr:hypothetical protein [Candidatus Kaiserbacteria bacterium]
MYRSLRIESAEAQKFRAQHLTDRGLIIDEWDRISFHYGVCGDTGLVAVFRLTAVLEQKLPFTGHVKPEAPLKNNSLEIGRLLIAPAARQSLLGLKVYRTVQASLASSGCIYAYADSIAKSGLTHLGFRRTTATYFDERYGAQSTVYEAFIIDLL